MTRGERAIELLIQLERNCEAYAGALELDCESTIDGDKWMDEVRKLLGIEVDDEQIYVGMRDDDVYR